MGLLEWVDHTTPVKSVLEEELALDAAFVRSNPGACKAGGHGVVKVDFGYIGSGNKVFRQFVPKKKDGAGNTVYDYPAMVKNKSREEAEKCYADIQVRQPPNASEPFLLTVTSPTYRPVSSCVPCLISRRSLSHSCPGGAAT